MMQLYYFRGKNFGDHLNAWLWEELLGPFLDNQPDLHLSVIGTIISNKMPEGKNWTVLGSGVGYSPLPTDFDVQHWNILAVRGPLTARVLKLDPTVAVTDGAILLAALAECKPIPPEQRNGIVYMPHFSVYRIGAYKAACDELGIIYLDPTADSRETVQIIRKASLVIADAMHAAIVADTLRVPWIPVASTRQISTFKWLDWTLSMGVDYRPQLLPPATGEMKWKNRASGILGKKYFLDSTSADDAVRDFENRQRFDRAGILDKLARNSRHLRKTTTADGAKISTLEDVAPSKDSRAIAQVLRGLISEAPYLSRDEIFVKRLQQMTDALAKVRAL